nr:hypothetical protein Iba_chr14bCG8280 [Ipomoea batatas]
MAVEPAPPLRSATAERRREAGRSIPSTCSASLNAARWTAQTSPPPGMFTCKPPFPHVSSGKQGMLGAVTAADRTGREGVATSYYCMTPEQSLQLLKPPKLHRRSSIVEARCHRSGVRQKREGDDAKDLESRIVQQLLT